MATPRVSRREALVELARRRARVDMLAFMRMCWWKKEPFRIGRHTRAICDRLTKANDDWRQGTSTYLLIAVPFRHGKSDMVSIALPAWFLGRNHDRDPDVIMSGYGLKLVADFSKKAKRVITSAAYRRIFPDVKLARGSNRLDSWKVEHSSGAVTASGLGGSLTGFGGHLIVVDDYCRKREEAVSKTYRDKTWDGFRNDLMTRQNPPACIVVVCATPWHIDDIRGRIIKAMAENADFPRFEELRFPATVDGQYEYLFPEMYPPEWYKAQRASLQRQAAAMLDCNPVPEGGNRFDPWRVVVHNTLDGWPKLREVRGWDLASSSKERGSSDPDRTWGVRGGVRRLPLGYGAVQHEVWISSAVAIRAEAPERDAFIRRTIATDGPSVAQFVEAFGGYKDAFTTLKASAGASAYIRASRLAGDKSAKLAPLEAPFQAGTVHIYAPGFGEWLDTWREEFAAFPEGDHDDACDATAIMFHEGGGSGSSVGVV